MTDARARAITRVVVKIGASVLTDQRGRPSRTRLRQLVAQLTACLREDREVVVVSSGAIACGMARLGMSRRPGALAELQACAAVGQGELMHLYSQACQPAKVTVAQVLLTESDLADRTRCANAKKTLRALMARRALPIINENDAVAVDEIAFGDNDRLAALVACVIEADMLVILTDVDGLLQDGRRIERIDSLNAHHHALAMGSSRETTTGGMASKLAAARITRHSGIPLVIANGAVPGIVPAILSGQPVGTLIAPPKTRLKFHKWWIAFSARQPKGSVLVDRGAAEALTQRGKSLLPSGIQEVAGRFHAGEPIAIVNSARQEIARGLSNFSSSELTRIRGLRSAQIVDVLGHPGAAEAVHRDNLVLTQELDR